MKNTLKRIVTVISMAIISLFMFLTGCGDDCTTMATLYGPMPCDSDQDCVDAYTDGWYCDEDNVIDDSCGGEVLWPTCKEEE